METVKDESFGVVPVCKVGEVWQVLLVHQISYRGPNDRFWTFPKGHPDEGESKIETAKRELMEETSVKDVRIIEEAEFTISYSFKHEGKRIDKSVSYYLGICGDTETEIGLPHEIADLAWCTFTEAANKLTHKNAQAVLLEAGNYITAHEDSL